MTSPSEDQKTKNDDVKVRPEKDEGKTANEEKVTDDQKPDIETQKESEVKTPLTCRELIEKIRRDEFGVGMHFGEEEKKILDIHRAREGRSLDRLSRELYTKDSHFVLELIQNADDNEYPDTMLKRRSCEKIEEISAELSKEKRGETCSEEKPMEIESSNKEKPEEGESSDEHPTVCFIVEKDSVTVLNNEKGFTEKNIRALCDIGRSTKGIHRKGYIGMSFDLS